MVEQTTPYPAFRFEQNSATIWLGGCIRSQGESFLERLERLYKVRAKQLHRALSPVASKIKLMQVQEALAAALGFPNTHALQQALSTLRTDLWDLDWTQLNRWLDQNEKTRLAVFALLYRLAGDFDDTSLPLEEGKLQLLTLLAKSLATHLDLPQELMHDTVARAWGAASDWKKLSTRTPLDGPLTEPLLTFSVEGDPTSRKSEGEFRLSQAGHWIWDNVLGSNPDAWTPKTPDEAQKALEKAIDVATRYPELYMAWAAAAGAVEDHHEALGLEWFQVLKMGDYGIAEAESTWPKNFNGKLSWYHGENRPYLNILHQKLHLELNTQYGLRAAQRTARKLLRLRPTDGSIIAKGPLLLGWGASPAVQRQLRAKALKQGDPSALLHAGLCLVLEAADPEARVAGVRHFVEGIFRVPEFGIVLLADPQIRPVRRYERPLGYTDVFDELEVVSARLAVEPELEAWVKAVLQDQELLAHEHRLDQLIGTRETGLNWPQWHEEVPRIAAQLAPGLLARHPVR